MATTKEAWKAFHKGDEELAASLFAEVTSAPSKTPHPHIQQALFFLKLDRFEEACLSLDKARLIEETNPAALFFLALAQELNGESEQSTASLKELRTLESHHQGASSLELLRELRHGDPLAQLRAFGFGPEDTSKAKPSASQRMTAALGMGNPEWLPSDLSSSDYLLGQILLEIESKLHPLEIPALEHHPPLLPDDLDSAQPTKRSLSEEVADLKKSIKAGPVLKKGKALLEKAFGLTDQGEQQDLARRAAIYLRLARKIDSYSFRVSYHLGEAYIFLAKNELGQPYSRFKLLQAQSSFLASADREGINPYLLFYLGYIQHLLGRPILAIKYYKEATNKFEKLPEAYYGQGQCQLLLGNPTQAKALFLKAVNSDLQLGRERLEAFATLLAEHGPEHFSTPLPVMPPEPIDPPAQEGSASQEDQEAAEVPEVQETPPTEEPEPPVEPEPTDKEGEEPLEDS